MATKQKHKERSRRSHVKNESGKIAFFNEARKTAHMRSLAKNSLKTM